MGNCIRLPRSSKSKMLTEPLMPMSEVISTVENLKKTNQSISQKLLSIETTMTSSYGELQLKINKITSEVLHISTDTLPNLVKSKGDVLQLREQIISMTDEIAGISESVDTMKETTLISSHLDPIKEKMGNISALSSQVSALKIQIDSMSKIASNIEVRDNFLEGEQ